MICFKKQPIRVAFRADASVQIGTGHVMRCMTLADALRDYGAECLFLCRQHDGNLLDLIITRGYNAIALPRRDAETAALDDLAAPTHAQWLGTDWATDAKESSEALFGRGVDWLVTDHYGLDRRWEQAMRLTYRRLLVLDDLADRPHDCDLLLDPSLGRCPEDYRDFLPPGAQMLLGPQYALLRPEFAALRAVSLARRRRPELKHLLITMGGVDKDNATGAVLDTLDSCELPSELRITVVMGLYAPWLPQVRQRAARMRQPTCVLADTREMARLMTEADLAIGAAGGTSWERCCLGLPTIQMVLAENQKEIATAFAKIGAAITVPDKMFLRETLPELLSELTLERLRLLSLTAARVVDGDGAARVLHYMAN